MNVEKDDYLKDFRLIYGEIQGYESDEDAQSLFNRLRDTELIVLRLIEREILKKR